MRSSTIFVVLISATLPIAAQSRSGDAQSQYSLPRLSAACPVQFSANREGGLMMRKTDDAQGSLGQGLDLKFVNDAGRDILSADITVHGYTGQVLAQPLRVVQPRERTEDFHLQNPNQRNLSTTSVWTHNISAVTWIELMRITFRDGTSWQRSAPEDCVVTPSLLVLVK
jgi:hypothetical protein